MTNMKLELKVWCFDKVEEIQTNSHDVMKTLTRNDFQPCFWSRKSHSVHCISAKEDNFEGDGGKQKFQQVVKLCRWISGTFG
jgi:hypothetical protein